MFIEVMTPYIKSNSKEFFQKVCNKSHFTAAKVEKKHEDTKSLTQKLKLPTLYTRNTMVPLIMVWVNKIYFPTTAYG